MASIRKILQAVDTTVGAEKPSSDDAGSAGDTPQIGRKPRIVVAALAVLVFVTVGTSATILVGAGIWETYPVLTTVFLILMAVVPTTAAAVSLPRFARCCQAFAERPDSEHEQIIIRMFLLSTVIAFLGVLIWTTDYHIGVVGALIAMAIGHCIAWALLTHILLVPAQSTTRRILGIFADQLILSYVLLSGGEEAAGLYLIYLWVTFGNGFRFGVVFLIAAALVSALGFGAVIAGNAYWGAHLYTSFGLLVALLVLPAYVMPLISRLNRARAQAEEANRSKGRFLATMSHELRTPLTAIIGMSGLMKSTKINDEQRSMVAAVDTSAQSLLSLINEILDFSKIEAGKLSLHSDAFDLHDVVARIWTMLHGQAEQKGLRLRVTMDAAVCPYLRGDAKRMGQILINLIGNAIKFTETGEVELSVQVQGSYSGEMLIRFEVADTGIGISPEKQGSVFEGFTQADDTIGRRYGGTGLGLAISKQLVEMMGGRIGVRSTPDEGSTFWLTVPFEIADEKDGPVETRGAPVMLICSDQSATDRLFLKMSSWLVEPVIVEHMETLRSILSDDGALGSTIVVVNDRASDPLVSSFLEIIRNRRLESQPAVIEVLANEPEDGPLSAREWPVSIAMVAADEERELRNALRAALAIKAPWSTPTAFSADGSDQQWPGGRIRRQRILLAEDNSTNRMVITRVLENGGHEVVSAADGDEALELLATGDFDVALMDLNMPGTSGLDVVRIHRMSENDGVHLPIIALTADATEQARTDCANAGMDDYLTKPVEPENLFAMIAQMAAAEPDGADASEVEEPESDEIVTPISQHPRYQTVVEPVVDRGALEALRTLDTDGSFFIEVLTEFMTDSESILDDMATASDLRDAVAFKDAAHSLRSSANHVGASRIVKMLMELRNARADELGDAGKPMIRQLRSEFAQVRSELERELGKQQVSRSGR